MKKCICYENTFGENHFTPKFLLLKKSKIISKMQSLFFLDDIS